MSSPEGAEGKKSWRQSDPEPAAHPAEEASPAPAPPRPARARRYLGGKTSSKVDNQSPTWYRLLLPITALSLIVASLVVLALMISVWWARPVLIAWAVTDYDKGKSLVVPINEFAIQDVNAIRNGKAFDSSRIITNTSPQEIGYFKAIFDDGGKVSEVTSKTLVIYISAHGISEDGKPVLKTANASDSYPVSAILTSIAKCPSKNKLLVLDVTRIESEFELGLLDTKFGQLGNDFTQLLQTEFDQIKDSCGNLWVVVSSSPGERAWSSRKLRHSVFGSLMAYALRGGVGVDTGNLKGRPDPDGTISAKEIVEFVRPRVAAWAASNRDDSAQNILVLTGGAKADFHVVGVDETVKSLASLDAEPDSGKRKKKDAKGPAPEPPKVEEKEKGSEKAKPTDSGVPENWSKEFDEAQKKVDKLVKAMEKSAESAEANPAGAEESAVPEEDVAAAVQALWVLRDQIEAKGLERGPSIPQLRPYQWAAFEEHLLFAERRFLAGQVKEAAEAIRDELLRDAKDLVQPFGAEREPPKWSLTFQDAKAKPEDPLALASKELPNYLSDPVKNRKLLDMPPPVSQTVEVALVTLVDAQLREGDKSKEAIPIFEAALRVRQLAETAATMPDPRLAPILREKLAAADQVRREAERKMALGRWGEAKTRLDEAGPQYEDIERLKTKQVLKDLYTVRRTASHLVHYVRWLGADPPDDPKRDERIHQLEKVIQGTRSFDPESSTGVEDLRNLAADCDTLSKYATTDYLGKLTNDSDWLWPRAAFEMAFLSADERERLRNLLLSPSDSDPLTAATGGLLNNGDYPANPYPLEGLAALLGGSGALIENLKKLGPLSNAPIRLSSIWKQEEQRALRSQVGMDVAALLNSKINQGSPAVASLASPKDVWLAEMSMLAIAPLKARVSRNSVDDDEFFRRVAERYRLDWLRSQRTRFELDSANVPGRVYDGAVDLVERSIKSLGGTDEFSTSPARFALQGSEIETQVDESPEREIELKPAPEVKGEEKPVLVLDWTMESRIRFSAESGSSSLDKELRIPLSYEPDRKVWTAKFRIEQSTDVPEASVARVLARVESDGSVDWLPLKVRLQPKVLPAATLEIGSLIEVYPNQAAAVGIQIRKNAEAELPLRIEFESGGEMTSWDFKLPAGAKGTMHALPLPSSKKPLSIKTAGRFGKVSANGLSATMAVRLLRAGSEESFDSRDVELRVRNWLDPRTFKVDLKPEFGEGEVLLVASVERVGPDPGQPIPVQLSVEGANVDVERGAIEPGQKTTMVPLRVKESLGDILHVNIDVADVPRAYRYIVDLRARDRTEDKNKRVRIVWPRPDAVLEYTANPEVQLHVDGVAWQEKAEVIVRASSLGESSKIGGGGAPPNPISNQAGRRVELTFLADAEVKEKPVSVRSVVKDLSDFPFQRPTTGRKTLTAQLKTQDGESIVSRPAVDLFLLRKDQLPGVRLELPEKSVYVGTPVRAVIRPLETDEEAKLYRAIDHVEFKFSPVKDFDDKLALVAIPESGDKVRLNPDSGRAVEQFLTQELKPQKWFLVARPVVNFHSPIPGGEPPKPAGGDLHGRDVAAELQVLPMPAPGGPAVAGEKPATLKVKTIKGGPGFKSLVKLDGPKPEKDGKSTNIDGEVEFSELPPGKYKITAERDLFKGTLDVELKPGDMQSVTVELK